MFYYWWSIKGKTLIRLHQAHWNIWNIINFNALFQNHRAIKIKLQVLGGGGEKEMYSKLLLMSGKHLNQAKLTLKFCLILSSDTDYFIFVSGCPELDQTPVLLGSATRLLVRGSESVFHSQALTKKNLGLRSRGYLSFYNQPWIFNRRTEAEATVLWPPDVKSWLIGKDPDAGKDWRQKEKRTAEDEMVR